MIRPPVGPFLQHKALLAAFGQHTGKFNLEAAKLGFRLVAEETDELNTAFRDMLSEQTDEGSVSPDILVPVIDGAVDVLVVTIGLLYAIGVDPQAAWDEVLRSNRSKIQADGKVVKNEFGKVLKGPEFSHPDLFPLAIEALNPAELVEA